MSDSQSGFDRHNARRGGGLSQREAPRVLVPLEREPSMCFEAYQVAEGMVPVKCLTGGEVLILDNEQAGGMAEAALKLAWYELTGKHGWGIRTARAGITEGEEWAPDDRYIVTEQVLLRMLGMVTSRV